MRVSFVLLCIMLCMQHTYAGPGQPTQTPTGGGNTPTTAPTDVRGPTFAPSPAPTSCMPAGAACGASNFTMCCSQFCLGSSVCATSSPTRNPTPSPTKQPTLSPTESPTRAPTTTSPTLSPTPVPWTGNPVVNVMLSFPDADAAGWNQTLLLGNVTAGLVEYLGTALHRMRLLNQTLVTIKLEILTTSYDSAARYVSLLNTRPGQLQQADQSPIFNQTQLGPLLFSIEAAAAISPTSSPVFTPRPTPAPSVAASKDDNTGAIVGAVIGVIGGLIVLLLVLLWCRKQKQQPQQRAPRKDGITFDKYKTGTTSNDGPKKNKEVKVNV